MDCKTYIQRTPITVPTPLQGSGLQWTARVGKVTALASALPQPST